MLRIIKNFVHIGAFLFAALQGEAQNLEHFDNWWQPTDGYVRSILADTMNDKLYLGGSFKGLGRLEPYGAAFDTSSSDVLSHFPSPSNAVGAVLHHDSLGWIISGPFDQVGGEPRNGIANIHNSGQLGLAFDNGLGFINGSVDALHLVGDTLFAGGSFSAYGYFHENSTIGHITDFQSISTVAQPNDEVLVCIPDGSGGWYLGGEFTEVGDSLRNRVAHILPNGEVGSWNPNANGTVHAILKVNDTIFIAGGFNQVGSQSVNQIAAIDSGSGMALNWTIPSLAGSINCIAATDTSLFIGGSFTTVGGQTRSRLAEVYRATNGLTSWTSTADATVNQIQLQGNTLYVCGNFTSLGGQTRNRIGAVSTATGNATSWSPNSNDVVNDMVLANGLLYAAGAFTSIGGQFRNRIAALSLTTGIATSFNPNADNDVTDISIADSIMYAVGLFEDVASEETYGFAALNLNTGDIYGDVKYFSSNPTCATASGSGIFIGGEFLQGGGLVRHHLAAIDLTTQKLLNNWNPRVDDKVFCIASHDDDLYFGGTFNNVSGISRDFLASVDRSTGTLNAWDAEVNHWVRTMVRRGDTMFIGGDFTVVHFQNRGHLAAIHLPSTYPTSWNPAIGNSFSDVYSIAVKDSFLFVGGAFGTASGQSRDNFAAYNLNTATITDYDPSPNDDVQSLAISGNRVIAGGTFSEFAGESRFGVAAFDLDSFGLLNWNPSIHNEHSVGEISCHGDQVYFGGGFEFVNTHARSGLAVLDANTGKPIDWSPTGPNFTGHISAMALKDSILVVGGSFVTMGGVTRRDLASWNLNTGDLTGWDPCGANSSIQVNALEISDTIVYVGGDYNSIGSVNRKNVSAIGLYSGNIHAWDPSPNGRVRDIELLDGYVYIGGEFSIVGGQTRNRLAAVQEVLGNLSSWSPSSTGNGNIYDIHFVDSVAYVGGNGSYMNGTYVRSLSSLDLSEGTLLPWFPLVGDGNVQRICVIDSFVYAGGDFDYVNTQFTTRTGIASINRYQDTLNAGSWAPELSNNNAYTPYVSAMASGWGKLFVTGSFDFVDGKIANDFAVFGKNQAPIIQVIEDQFICPANSASITLNILDEFPSTINVSATSSNQSVVSNTSVNLTGAGLSWDLSLSTSAVYDSTTITITAEDGNGNTSFTSFQVFTTDTAPPQITAPDDIHALTSSNSCNATGVDLGEATVYENCELDTLYNDAPPTFSLGQTEVHWIAIDQFGLSDTAIQVVTIIDSIPPSIVAPAEVSDTATGINCWVTNTPLGAPSAFDNCGIASITNNAPDTFYIGSTEVTWLATDSSGNTDTATQKVVVIDQNAPILSVPADTFAYATNSACGTTAFDLGQALAVDYCVGSVTLTNNADSFLSVGQNNILWTAADTFGNVTLDSQLIIVYDTITPQISAPSDLVTNIDSASCAVSGISLGSPVTSDNCSIDSVTNNAPSSFPIGTTTVHWTVYAGGLSASDSQIIAVLDNLPPTITAPSNISISAAAGQCYAVNVYLGEPAALDNCNAASVSSNAPDTFNVGSTIVTWTVTDLSGNTASDVQTVTVTENVPPLIVAPSDITVQTDANSCFATNVSLSNPSVSDNCSTPSVTNNAPLSFPIGTTVVQWTAIDLSGNISTDSQLVTVIDTIPPMVIAPANINQLLNGSQCALTGLNIGSPTVFDNCGIQSVTNNAPGIFTIGTTTVTWIVSDSVGNQTMVTQQVTLTESQPPVLSAPTDITVNVDSNSCTATEVSLGTPSVFDNCSTPQVSNDAPSTFPVGVTTVTWIATDASGNVDSSSQTVTVIDNISPTIQAPDTTFAFTDTNSCMTSNLVLETPVASDNCNLNTVTNNAPPSYPIGLTLVVWTATDSAGNIAVDTQAVIVSDTFAPVPVVASLPIIFGECNASVTSVPMATDNCGGSITASTLDPTAYSEQGYYSITWQFDDGYGNLSYQQQSVVVNDTTPPIITGCPDDLEACASDSVFFDFPVASDNCSGVDVAQTGGLPSGSVFPVGINTIMFTASDSNGNVSFCAFDITVHPTPVVVIQTIDASCNGSNDGKASASVSGGQPPYSFDWLGADSSQLPAGTHPLIVTDFNGCQTIDTVEILHPDPLQLTITASSDSLGDCSGMAGVEVSGGTTPYSYIWSDSLAQTTATATGLCNGSYCVTVSDSNNCQTDTCGVEILLSSEQPVNDRTVRFFPNPSRGIFTLKIDGFNRPAQLTIVDGLGKVVLKRVIVSEQESFDLQEFGSGVYSASVQLEDYVVVTRLILL